MDKKKTLSAADAALKKRLIFSIALTGVIFFAELGGGYLTNSLALMSDAAHVFMDVFALSLSLFAVYISGLPPTGKRTYGLHRVEVFVSFINSFMLLLVTLFIFYRAYGRLVSPQPVESTGMLIVAVIGLLVNVIVAIRLKSFAAGDLNIRSAFLHVLGDAAASVGVILASIVIYYTGWYLIDPLISLMIGCIIFYGVARIMTESSQILLEGVPGNIDINSVVKDIKAMNGVASVHNLHLWSICHNVYALSAHIDIMPAERWRMGGIFKEINEILADRYHIFYTTLQAECLGCDLNDTFGSVAHRVDNHIH